MVPSDRSPVVLIVDNEEWSCRSLEGVLSPSGYVVVEARSVAAGLEIGRTRHPDAVFISNRLPDNDGVGLCQQLRNDAAFGAAIPIIMTGPEDPNDKQRLAALQAGAWEFVPFPIDVAQLLLRLETYIRAKLEVDRVRDQSLVDELTGLYNLQGLEKRAREIHSQAHREAQPLACVVVAPAIDPETGKTASIPEAVMEQAVQHLGQVLRNRGRTSDAIGRLGHNEFAIVAPNTDRDGAVKLAQRLAAALAALEPADDEGEPTAPITIRVGFDAVPNVREAPVAARDLIAHAAIALRESVARETHDDEWIHAFRDSTTIH